MTRTMHMMARRKHGTFIIRAKREALGLTQQQLAEKIHTTQAVISRIENGHTKPRRLTLEAIARALRIRLTRLI